MVYFVGQAIAMICLVVFAVLSRISSLQLLWIAATVAAGLILIFGWKLATEVVLLKRTLVDKKAEIQLQNERISILSEQHRLYHEMVAGLCSQIDAPADVTWSFLTTHLSRSAAACEATLRGEHSGQHYIDHWLPNLEKELLRRAWNLVCKHEVPVEHMIKEVTAEQLRRFVGEAAPEGLLDLESEPTRALLAKALGQKPPATTVPK